jgi:uncharacterized protein (DUF983 family)
MGMTTAGHQSCPLSIDRHSSLAVQRPPPLSTNTQPTEPNVPKRPLGVVLKRAVKLRCPRCGDGRLFVGYFTMHARCADCNLKYERDPGYFLGSTYINYGLTAVTITVLYIVLHFMLEFNNRTLAFPLTALCVAVPLLFFRHARALWIAIDCFFDAAGFESDDG